MSLIEQLKQILDVRHRRGLRHPLWIILLLSLLGYLRGYRGYRPLADFCLEHESSLRALLGLSPTQPLPSYSTFRRSFLQVDPQGWVNCSATYRDIGELVESQAPITQAQESDHSHNRSVQRQAQVFTSTPALQAN